MLVYMIKNLLSGPKGNREGESPPPPFYLTDQKTKRILKNKIKM
jgi:hypothetical protein